MRKDVYIRDEREIATTGLYFNFSINRYFIKKYLKNNSSENAAKIDFIISLEAKEHVDSFLLNLLLNFLFLLIPKITPEATTSTTNNRTVYCINFLGSIRLKFKLSILYYIYI
jgi:hypothetical protein